MIKDTTHLQKGKNEDMTGMLLLTGSLMTCHRQSVA